MSDLARVMEVVRDAALRGDDLSAALRSCGLPGAADAAGRLAGGATLPEALHGLVPPQLSALLTGGIPPLATMAAVLADEAWRAAEHRRMVHTQLSYPLASCLILVVIACAVHQVLPAGPWYGSLVSLAWAAPPAALALLLACAPLLPRSWPLPGASWIRHLDLAARWSRAALAVHWRLTEEQAARLLGVDLMPMAAVLATAGAEEHCRMLADWHARTAHRRLALTAILIAALILLSGGCLVLGSLRMWTGTAL